MYLLDTVVLSELRKRRKDRNVVNWLKSTSHDQIFLSVITIAEIERGIERQRSSNPAFAQELGGWLDIVLRVYADRILPLTLGISRRWGRITEHVRDRDMDTAIAATALEHSLTVVTRNVSDFELTGAPTFNPFEAERM